MKKDLTVQNTEALSGLVIPENVKKFSANSESAMNLFVYAKFELAEENVNDFLLVNKFERNDDIFNDFSAYNQHMQWWNFKEEMKNPSYYSCKGKKGKWKTDLSVAISQVGGKALIYVLYFEEI